MNAKALCGVALLLLARLSAAQVPAGSCIDEAARFHGVHPGLLRAVLVVESGLNARAVNINRNGTIDIGIGQINSMHLPELAMHGITRHHLMDACVGTYVVAWMLRRQIHKHGNTWRGVATYHSATAVHNARYARQIHNQLVRDGWISGQLLAVDALGRNAGKDARKEPRLRSRLVVEAGAAQAQE